MKPILTALAILAASAAYAGDSYTFTSKSESTSRRENVGECMAHVRQTFRQCLADGEDAGTCRAEFNSNGCFPE